MQQLLELQQQPKELRTELFMQLMWNSDDHNRVTPLKALLEAGASKHSAKPSTSGFVNFQGPTVHCYTFHCYTKRPGHLQVITHRLREVFKSSTVLGPQQAVRRSPCWRLQAASTQLGRGEDNAGGEQSRLKKRPAATLYKLP